MADCTTDISPDPTAVLPDGRSFVSWHPGRQKGRVWHVSALGAGASDDNDGREAAPLRTVSRAAELAEPGDTVLIHEGIYRECVRPPRGGDGPEAMITYAAAEGEQAVLTGGEIVPDRWQSSDQWWWAYDVEPVPAWCVRLPRDWFAGGNPFATPNRAVSGNIGGFDQSQADIYSALCRRAGMLFQEGVRLRQVNHFTELSEEPGTWWPDPSGLVLHVRPLDDAGPHGRVFEATARSQCFAPDIEELGYIRLRGLAFRCAGNQFPFMPQEGAVSTNRGHHWIIEDCLVEQVNSVGIDAGKRDWRMVALRTGGGQIIRRNVVRECGICGIAGVHMVDSLIEDNLVEDCCRHDVENMWESAGIKTHRNENTLVRRNVVRRIAHGSGLWLDFDNDNLRVTSNLVVDVTSLFGGIFVEATHVACRVDTNIVIGSRCVGEGGGHGVYTHDTDYLIVDHNLFADTESEAVHLAKGQAQRWVRGRGSTSKHHRVLRNLMLGCGRFVALADADNACDGNVYGEGSLPGPLRLMGPDEWLDLEAWRDFHGFDPDGCIASGSASCDTRMLRGLVVLEGELPGLEPLDDLPGTDWFGNPPGEADLAGPFRADAVPAEETDLDPRKL